MHATISSDAHSYLGPGCYSEKGWAADHGLKVTYKRDDDQIYRVSGKPAHVRAVVKAAAAVETYSDACCSLQHRYTALLQRGDKKLQVTLDETLRRAAMAGQRKKRAKQGS